MSENQPLHLKYRPTTFDDVVGNKSTVDAIKKLMSREARPHSYLLTGPKGTGKTTVARIIASALGCSSNDFHEMNSASYRGIDSVRSLIDSASLNPWEGDVSVYLLDEVHQLTKDAQNAILKTLEEAPPHAYFVLATTEPDKLLDTIRSRCAHFAMQALPVETIYDRLYHIVEQEGCPEEYPTEKVLDHIAKQSGGSLRQAVMILDQVIDIEDESRALEAVIEATYDDRQVLELCRALLKGNKWALIQTILGGIDSDPETVRYQVLGYLNAVMLKANPQEMAVPFSITQHFLPSMMYTGKAGLTSACFKAWDEQFHRTRGG